MYWNKFVVAAVATCTLGVSVGTIPSPAAPQASAAPSAARTTQTHPTGSEWWRDAVIYQVYPRSFQDTNGDGIGDLNGITEHLDYLQKLGVDAIWLSPVYPSPNFDVGYDVSDYRDINPEYGTMADFNRLMAEANKRHIRVIMDMVMNHTSDMNAWFVQSRSSRTDPYRDWYVWHDGKGETATDPGGPPNNWGFVGRSSWTWDETTRQYYYHAYSAHQPDLNWYNPAVHEEFKDILGYWLKQGVAGFRFDAVAALYEDPSFADEAPAKDKDGKPILDRLGHPMNERTKTSDLPAVHTVIQEMRARIDSFDSSAFPGSRVMIGEVFPHSNAELLNWYGSREKPEFQLPMDMQIGFIDKLDVATFRQKIMEAETRIEGNVPLIVFDNHDRPRLDARFGDGIHDVAIQRVISTILFASGGASLMYYGDEIGMKTTPPTRMEDVKDRMAGVAGWPRFKGRDGERTPMQWDAGKNAGFSAGAPWLPVPSSAASVNVAAEERDPGSLLAWCRSLIRLKKSVPALESGANVMLDTKNTKVLSWKRELAGRAPVIVVLNFTAEPQTVNLVGPELNDAPLRTLLKSPGAKDPGTPKSISLGPFGVYVGEIKQATRQ
jgi:alpha-glucosidase